MQFVRINQAHPFLESIQLWYENSFPPSERRTFCDLLRLLPYPEMHLCGLVSEDKLVGFIIYWQWEECLFVEHFAIDPGLRGRQYGQQALDIVFRQSASYVVLEVELPNDNLSIRRIAFYERQGFYLNVFPYAQPPYQRGNPSIPMHLLSTPAITSQQLFTEFSTLIYERVYQRFYD
ncbi:GNAT family N-acetyltransferase [Spirosoma aerophilum]